MQIGTLRIQSLPREKMKPTFNFLSPDQCLGSDISVQSGRFQGGSASLEPF